MLQFPLSPGSHAIVTTRAEGNLAPAAAVRLGEAAGAAEERRRHLASGLGMALAWMHQVHGTHIAFASGDLAVADGIISTGPLCPAVITGDCVPLLLGSESGGVRAAVHVGRAGLFDGVVAKALSALREVTSEKLYALAGPHICGSCYEVGGELADQAAALGAGSTTAWGTPAIDLRAGIEHQLGGIPLVHCGICTFEDRRFDSYRRDPRSGRFATIAAPGSLNTPS